MSETHKYKWEGDATKRSENAGRGAKGPNVNSESSGRLVVPQKFRDVLSEVRLRSRFWAWRFELFNKEHSGVCKGAKYIFGVAGFVLVVGLSVGLIYYGKACRYDLKEVAHVRGGADVIDWSGATIGRIVPKNRKIVNLEQVPPHLIDALLATEDERFYEHEGYDFWGMARAGIVNLRSRRIRQGASTITQQLARNACALTERSYDRKLTEIFLAWRIERAFSKSEILVGYLNRIYLGSGYWGIGAAAEGYFAKEVSELDLGECAMICGIIKSPHPSSPFRNYERAVAARDDTLQRMVRSGLLEAADAEAWLAKETRVRRFKQLDIASPYVLAQIGRETNRLIIRDSFEGLKIETSLDIRLQHQVETAVEETLREIEAAPSYDHPTRAQFTAGETEVESGVPYLQAAVVVLQNATGEVVAAVGTRSHRESEYDRVWRSNRSAGSAFLPLLYASAFENPRLSPQTLVFDAPLDNREVMIGGRSGILGEWCSESQTNYFEGMMPAAWAFLRGKSSASVRLGFETGLLPMHDIAMRAGIVSPLREYPSSFLGSSEVNLAELTHAYTMFPNLGWRPSRSGLVRKIVDEEGNVLFEEQNVAKTVRVISEATAAQMNALMAKSLPLRKDGKALPVRGEIAGKTGISYEGTDHWFVGFNSQFTWGVWVGFDLPARISDRLKSRDTAFQLWSTLAESLDSGEPLMTISGLEDVTICEKGCEACQNAEHAKVALPKSVSRAAVIASDVKPTVRAVPIAGVTLVKIDEPKAEPVKLNLPPLVGQDPYGALLEGEEVTAVKAPESE
tara:strand:+ start:3030 stop:5414 length:2385 start_codon:yes stop_codon:yes gene_type:complete